MKPFEQYTDLEIIHKILNGESALFEILIRRYNSLLYKTGRSYNFGHEDTQDLLQDSYINAYTSLNHFENRSSFKTWLIKIMLHNCYRKKQKFSFRNEVSNEITDKSIPMFSSLQQHTNSAIQTREINLIIENALEKIPLDYRMIFSLRALNFFSVAETAEVLGLSETNVKVRLNRAKAMLRKEIEKSYTTEDIYEFNLVYCDAITNKVMSKINELETQILK